MYARCAETGAMTLVPSKFPHGSLCWPRTLMSSNRELAVKYTRCRCIRFLCQGYCYGDNGFLSAIGVTFESEIL